MNEKTFDEILTSIEETIEFAENKRDYVEETFVDQDGVEHRVIKIKDKKEGG